MKTSVIFLLISICLQLKPIELRAQVAPDSIKIYQVETTDGNVYFGKIIFRNDTALVLKTEKLGELKFIIADVKYIKMLSPEKVAKGEQWFENPYSSRYFYLPNGYGLNKGEGYYQNTWVLFNQVSYGITNNFSLGLGLIPTFLFGADGAPVWITPKISFPVKENKWNVGVGAIVGTYIESGNQNPGLGIVYGVSTFGSRDENFTIGAGYAFAAGEWSSNPVISIGGTVRTGRKHYLVTENYIIFADGEGGSLIWLGGRFVSTHVAIDYGFIIPTFPEMDRLIAIPWLSLTVPFGTTLNH